MAKLSFILLDEATDWFDRELARVAFIADGGDVDEILCAERAFLGGTLEEGAGL